MSRRGPFLIGITGRAGSGKDALARYLIAAAAQDDYVGVRCALADALKGMARPLFGLSKRDVSTPRGKARVLPSGRSVRSILQDFGVGVRAIDPDAWVRALRARVTREAVSWGYPHFIVVPDVRFDNEAAEMDIVLRVVRPGQPLIAESGHASEAGIRDEIVDQTAVNDGSLADLRGEATCVFQDCILPRL